MVLVERQEPFFRFYSSKDKQGENEVNGDKKRFYFRFVA